jgi:hypothetical protein
MKKNNSDKNKIKFESFKDEYYLYLKSEITAYSYDFGKVILEINLIPENTIKEELIFPFFENNRIYTSKNSYYREKFNLDDFEISKEIAVDRMFYSLNGITNNSESHKIKSLVYAFIDLFECPKFYSYDAELWQNLEQEDHMWSYGGAIIIDKNKIGIFWVNDFAD